MENVRGDPQGKKEERQKKKETRSNVYIHPVITCLNKYPAYNGISRRVCAKGSLWLEKEIGLIEIESTDDEDDDDDDRV